MFEYSKYSIIHEIYIRWREFEMGYYWLGCLKKRNVLKVWMHFAKCEEILISQFWGTHPRSCSCTEVNL